MLACALVVGPALGDSGGVTFVVNSNADPGNGVCDATSCTLREAIAAANSSPGTDTIDVSLTDPAQRTITLASPAAGGGALPAITETVVLDASASGNVQVKGQAAGPNANGLSIQADGTTVRALHFFFFAGHGAVIAADDVSLIDTFLLASGGDGAQIIGSNNTLSGVQILSNKSRGVSVVSGSGNEIHGWIEGSGRLGIDLGANGLTPNDAGDSDDGPNGLQNAPVLSIDKPGSEYRAIAELDSTPGRTFTIDFVTPGADDTPRQRCDGSGYGEGGSPMWSTQVTTDANGHASAVYPPIGRTPLRFGQVVTVTATDETTGDTSEYSNCERAGYSHASVDINALPDEIRAGEETTLRIDFENPGPWTALDVELGIVIPEATEILDIRNSTGGECNQGPGLSIWCELGDVPVGDEIVELLLRPQEPRVHGASVVISSDNVEWGLPGIVSRTRIWVDCTKTGGPGDNVIIGTPGDDVLCGGPGEDTINGRGGNDILLGGRGNDVLIGGPGFDVASFADSPRGVRASLTSGSASNWGSDRLAGFEGLVGSHHRDYLTGNAGRNVFRGLQGRDSIFGGRGNDHSSILDRLQDFYNGGTGRDSVKRDADHDILKSVERRS